MNAQQSASSSTSKRICSSARVSERLVAATSRANANGRAMPHRILPARASAAAAARPVQEPRAAPAQPSGQVEAPETLQHTERRSSGREPRLPIRRYV